MRKTARLLLLGCALGVAAAITPPTATPARAQDQAGGPQSGWGPNDADAPFRARIRDGIPYGPRGLGGTTLTTGRVDPPPPSGYRNDGPGGTGSLGALILKDPRFVNELLPCDHEQALAVITRNFARKESLYWNSTLTIGGYDRIRTVATNPWGPNAIPKRFCSARAHLSDGKVRQIDYFIAEGQGIIGASFGVEWCVHGLDRGRSFDPSCRMARP